MAMTVPVEIDEGSRAKLRALHPGRSDLELIQSLVTREVGMAAMRESQRRNALPEDEALELGGRPPQQPVVARSAGARRRSIDARRL
jgi:hypothetical protein